MLFVPFNSFVTWYGVDAFARHRQQKVCSRHSAEVYDLPRTMAAFVSFFAGVPLRHAQTSASVSPAVTHRSVVRMAKSEAIPFLEAQPNLNKDHPGYCGFDPVGLSNCTRGSPGACVLTDRTCAHDLNQAPNRASIPNFCMPMLFLLDCCLFRFGPGLGRGRRDQERPCGHACVPYVPRQYRKAMRRSLRDLERPWL